MSQDTEALKIAAGAGAVIVVPLSLARERSITAGAGVLIVVYDEGMDGADIAVRVKRAAQEANGRTPRRHRELAA